MVGAGQPTFGPPLNIPMYIDTKSGTVNLESFDELEAKGTYEFTAFSGEKITGSFSYSLK